MGKKLGSCLLACIIIMSLATVALAADSSAPDLKVMVDSCIVDFPDAQPQMVDGRVMLPLRQVLEILGAEVTYQDNNISITYGDTIVEFTIGYKLLDIKKGEDINSWVFDVAPYLEQGTNRVMVPVRFISEALGFNVGWDSDEKTVVIINTEKMASRLAENLQTLNYLFQLPEDYYENNYQIDQQMNLTFNIENNDVDVHITNLQLFSPTLQQTSGTVKLQIPLDVGLRLLSLFNGIDTELSNKEFLVLKNLQNIDLEYRFDIATGVLYVHSSQVNQVLQNYEIIDDSDSWFFIDCRTVLGDYYDFLSLYFNRPESLDRLLSAIINVNIFDPQVGDYEGIVQKFSEDSAYVKDDAFTKTTQNGYDVYTLKFTGNNDSEPELDVYDYANEFIIRCQNNMMVDYNLSNNVTIENEDYFVHLKRLFKYDAGLNYALEVDWSSSFGYDFTSNLKTTYQATKKAPQASVPEDTPVWDLTQSLIEIMYY